MQKATYVYAITFRRLQPMGEAALFRYRTLVVVGVLKQRLERVFKAEPDLHIHETAIKQISSYPEVNTKK